MQKQCSQTDSVPINHDLYPYINNCDWCLPRLCMRCVDLYTKCTLHSPSITNGLSATPHRYCFAIDRANWSKFPEHFIIFKTL